MNQIEVLEMIKNLKLDLLKLYSILTPTLYIKLHNNFRLYGFWKKNLVSTQK